MSDLDERIRQNMGVMYEGDLGEAWEVAKRFLRSRRKSIFETPLQVAERLRREVESHFEEKGPRVTISAGIATYVPNDEIIDALTAYRILYNQADLKLYDAKKQGKNKVVW